MLTPSSLRTLKPTLVWTKNPDRSLSRPVLFVGLGVAVGGVVDRVGTVTIGRLVALGDAVGTGTAAVHAEARRQDKTSSPRTPSFNSLKVIVGANASCGPSSAFDVHSFVQ